MLDHLSQTGKEIHGGGVVTGVEPENLLPARRLPQVLGHLGWHYFVLLSGDDQNLAVFQQLGAREWINRGDDLLELLARAAQRFIELAVGFGLRVVVIGIDEAAAAKENGDAAEARLHLRR